MAAPKPALSKEQNTSGIAEEAATRLEEAVGAATRAILDRYDDQSLLSIQQARLIAKVKRAVRDELRGNATDLLAQLPPRPAGRTLGEIITKEVRRRQFAAFERRLAEQYGPLLAADLDFSDHLSEPINGVRLFAVTDPALDADDAPRR